MTQETSHGGAVKDTIGLAVNAPGGPLGLMGLDQLDVFLAEMNLTRWCPPVMFVGL